MSGRFYLELRKLWKGRLFQNFSDEIFLVLVGQCPWSSGKFLSVPLICYLVPICSGCNRGTRTFCQKTFCRKIFCRTDILHADGHFVERTFCGTGFWRTDFSPKRHFAERTICRKIEMLFRQNIKHSRSPILFFKLFGTVTQLSCESLTVHNHFDSLFVQRVTHLLGTCCDVRL
jgi:hypothetical protein